MTGKPKTKPPNFHEWRDWISNAPLEDAIAVLTECTDEELRDMAINFSSATLDAAHDLDEHAFRRWRYASAVVDVARYAPSPDRDRKLTWGKTK